MLKKIFLDPDECKPTRLCQVKEFVTRQHQIDPLVPPLQEGFTFDLKFGAPESSRGGRANAPYKTVHKEYYLITRTQLIGTVGGTMGMFIGFSFSGTLTWILDLCNQGWLCVGRIKNMKMGQKQATT